MGKNNLTSDAYVAARGYMMKMGFWKI